MLPEQISILEDKWKNIIIYGAPGTGKTLLVMMKALQWSKEEREGRVMVKLKKALIPLYQRFFDANKDKMKRKPFVQEMGYGAIANKDDYLRDEDNTPSPGHIKFLTDRAKANGRNFIAVTGAVSPWALWNYENAFTNKYSELAANYSIHPLWTVLRGTMEVVNYWNKELQLPKLTIGHSISGCAVDNRNTKLPNTEQVLKCILENVQTILNGITENDCQNKNTVAVICSHPIECTEVKTILENNNISVRSVDESNSSNASIVVDWYDSVLSYEWPTVLAVSVSYPIHYSSNFFPIVASRAICQLIIIGRDAMPVVNGIADKFANTDKSSIPYSDFKKSVMELSQEVGETAENSLLVNHWFSALHLNYLPCEVRAIDEELSQCKNLADYLSLMVNDNEHVMAFCRYSSIVKQILERCKQFEGKAHFQLPRMSKFFKELLPTELKCAFDGFLPIFCNAVTVLTINQLENDELQYSDKVNQLSNQLNECDAWKECTIKCADGLLASTLVCRHVAHSQLSVTQADNLEVRKQINISEGNVL